MFRAWNGWELDCDLRSSWGTALCGLSPSWEGLPKAPCNPFWAPVLVPSPETVSSLEPSPSLSSSLIDTFKELFFCFSPLTFHLPFLAVLSRRKLVITECPISGCLWKLPAHGGWQQVAVPAQEDSQRAPAWTLSTCKPGPGHAQWEGLDCEITWSWIKSALSYKVYSWSQVTSFLSLSFLIWKQMESNLPIRQD